MLIKLWPGYWIDQLKRMNKKVNKKTVNSWLKVMFGIAKFVASQDVNSGRILIVLFQCLPLVLGGRGYWRRKRS